MSSCVFAGSICVFAGSFLFQTSKQNRFCYKRLKIQKDTLKIIENAPKEKQFLLRVFVNVLDLMPQVGGIYTNLSMESVLAHLADDWRLTKLVNLLQLTNVQLM